VLGAGQQDDALRDAEQRAGALGRRQLPRAEAEGGLITQSPAGTAPGGTAAPVARSSAARTTGCDWRPFMMGTG
jgi:hypothetical protein